MTEPADFPNPVVVDRIADLAADYRAALNAATIGLDSFSDFEAACVAAGRARDTLAVAIRAHAFQASGEPDKITVPLLEIADLIVRSNRNGDADD
jgi:hypothetical protein